MHLGGWLLLLNYMKVFVNNEEITIHHGARVLDVIRAYYAQHNKKLPCKLPIACDVYGNSIAPDGELSEGNHLYIKIKTNEKKSTISTNNTNAELECQCTNVTRV